MPEKTQVQKMNELIAAKMESDNKEFKALYETSKQKFINKYRELFGVTGENAEFDQLYGELFNDQVNHQFRGLYDGPTLGETRR